MKKIHISILKICTSFHKLYCKTYHFWNIRVWSCQHFGLCPGSAIVECTANFQWRRKSSQNVNKDFLVVIFGNITKDFISWRRCAKMKIRYYESIRPKKSEKISLFDFQNKKNVQVRTYSRKYLDPVKLFVVQNTLFHLCTSTVI